MKYLQIKNQGMIEAQALTLMGASSKVGDSSKIGMFGSGNKYAIAFFIRNNIGLKVFTGKKEIKITTEIQEFREQSFSVILIDGQKTSITTTMGKDWILWQAIREIYCNALDEGSDDIKIVDDISPMENETHFYIEMTTEIEHFMGNFDNYFTKDKTIVQENEVGQIFTCSDALVNVFRKGIRCWDSHKTSVYDYNFNEMDINESRVVRYQWEIYESFFQLLIRSTDNEVMDRIFGAMRDRLNFECLAGMCISLPIDKSSTKFKNYVYTNKFAPLEMGGSLTEKEVEEFTIVPLSVYEAIEPLMNEDNKAEAFRKSTGGEFFFEIENLSQLQQVTMDRAMEFFKECKYDINYEIVPVQFVKKHILGMAENNKIYVSDIAIEKGVHDLCNTIIEEQIHLKYETEDHSRLFQTSAINEMLTVMKQAYAFPM
jgi:hypothetical protein